MSISGRMSVDMCDHCENSTCQNCDDKYYGGIENPDCCNGYHW